MDNDDKFVNKYDENEEYDRSEYLKKKRRKSSFRIKMILFIIAACAAAFLAVNSQFVRGLKYNSETIDETSPSVSIENGFGYGVASFKNILVTASQNGVRFYNNRGDLIENKKTDKIYSALTDISELSVKAADTYLLAYDEGGKLLYKMDENGIAFHTKLDYNIILARPFNNHQFIAVTEDAGSLNRITVYNQHSEEIYIWHSGDNYVLDAAVSSDGKKMAVCTLIIQEGVIKSEVLLFNLNETKPYASVVFDDVMLTSINYNSQRDIAVLGDKALIHLNGEGKQISRYDFGAKTLKTYKFIGGGNTVLCYRKDNENQSAVEIVTKKGTVCGTYTIEDDIVSADYLKGSILIATKREFAIITSRGMGIRKSAVNREIKEAHFLGKSKFALVGSSNILISE